MEILCFIGLVFVGMFIISILGNEGLKRGYANKRQRTMRKQYKRYNKKYKRYNKSDNFMYMAESMVLNADTVQDYMDAAYFIDILAQGYMLEEASNNFINECLASASKITQSFRQWLREQFSARS